MQQTTNFTNIISKGSTTFLQNYLHTILGNLATLFTISVASCVVGEVPILMQLLVITKKNLKNSLHCWYVRCATCRVIVVGMPWLKAFSTHYLAQLGLPDEGRAIKFIVYWVTHWTHESITPRDMFNVTWRWLVQKSLLSPEREL